MLMLCFLVVYFSLVDEFLLLMETFTLRPLTSAVESNESTGSAVVPICLEIIRVRGKKLIRSVHFSTLRQMRHLQPI